MSVETATNDAACVDLTAFQRDVLCIVAKKGGPVYGLGIKSELEHTRMDEEVNHGRLYPNLDQLVDAGYLTKESRDKRTNEYGLTEGGKRELAEYHAWVEACLSE